MAALRVFLPLTICLLLGHQTFAQNDAPCQKWNNNGFDTFVKRHIRARLPSTLDQNEWKKYISTNGLCDRPKQSFLLSEDLENVKAVCTNEGKKYERDLCISNQRFTFFTVTSETGTCNIWSVCKENKHLILGCGTVKDKCLPVHFHANHQNEIPDNNAKSCQAP